MPHLHPSTYANALPPPWTDEALTCTFPIPTKQRYSGLRPGELVALRVRRLDLLAGTARVVEATAGVSGHHITGPTRTYDGPAGRAAHAATRGPPLLRPAPFLRVAADRQGCIRQGGAEAGRPQVRRDDPRRVRAPVAGRDRAPRRAHGPGPRGGRRGALVAPGRPDRRTAPGRCWQSELALVAARGGRCMTAEVSLTPTRDDQDRAAVRHRPRAASPPARCR